MYGTYLEKLKKLENILKGYSKIALAFSGGVDSTFLLCYAKKILGKDNVLAITATSMNFAKDEIDFAKEYASFLEIQHKIIPIDMSKTVEIKGLSSNCNLQSAMHSPFSDDFFLFSHDDAVNAAETEYNMYSLFDKNPENRCYYCKKIIFLSLMDYLVSIKKENYMLCDGTNADDANDYRPGRKALKELNIQSPLELSGLTKAEIRKASKELNIPIWDKPAFACLASRVPYGEAITETKLIAIYELEKVLQNAGYRQCRVRCHGDFGQDCFDATDYPNTCADSVAIAPRPAIARIEVLPDAIQKLTADYDLCKELQTKALVLGFDYCTIDLKGYRMGSLNETITGYKNK